MPERPPYIRIHENDNVVVALSKLDAGVTVQFGPKKIMTNQSIPRGHKIALYPIEQGQNVIKYGHIIGKATDDIEAGDLVHTHNLQTRLDGKGEYTYEPVQASNFDIDRFSDMTFRGYVRDDGRVATRNEIWVLNTVGCVNTSAEHVVKQAQYLTEQPSIDGVYTFPHPFGCSQLGDDLKHTQKLLASLIRHPNAGGVVVMGLGCENNKLHELIDAAGAMDERRLRFFNAQDVEDEIDTGLKMVEELAQVMKLDRREKRPISDLVLGVKCGGSDALSGLSANPLVGRTAEVIAGHQGKVMMTEVPEMFGAEQQLMNRAKDEEVFEQIVKLIDDFKSYFISHDQPIYENPSPGNIDGGITTLEEKSLGAVQKGGRVPVTDVLDYAETVKEPGLSLVMSPGNDGVSSTALTAAGATMLLFTTGRGTPLGFPVPTLKVSSNTALQEHKPKWIDFNAGAQLDGLYTQDTLLNHLMEKICQIASGELRTWNEIRGYREIAIWKEGVTL